MSRARQYFRLAFVAFLLTATAGSLQAYRTPDGTCCNCQCHKFTDFWYCGVGPTGRCCWDYGFQVCGEASGCEECGSGFAAGAGGF